MQTFLPYEDFARSAAALDRLRLNAQRREAMQIMRALTIPTYGWQNHAAVRMWRGHEFVLLEYELAICHEWTDVRGYKDTCYDKAFDAYEAFDRRSISDMERPPWLGDEAFHRSHRSNLVRKDPAHYGPLFPDADPTADYVWPV